MATKRFSNLDPAKQKHLLETAAREFAANGYEHASYNRIIALSGTSKGSMYYYFEDKSDLYATVVLDAVTRFLTYLGALPAVDTAEDFWSALECMYVRSMQFYEEDPSAVGLTRTWATTASRGEVVSSLTHVRMLSANWMRAMVEEGRQLGAIRSDLPDDLLIQVAVSLSEGIDLWLSRNIDHLSADDLRRMAKQFIDLYRRVAAPSPEIS